MKSLNKIFKSVRKTLNDLDRYVEHTDSVIDANESVMAEIQSENLTHRDNKAKALKARSRFADLIGDDE